MNRERTMQQLDPLGSAGSRDAALLITVCTWLYATIGMISDFPLARNDSFLVLSFILISFASIVNLIASSPKNAPYSRTMFSLMLTFAISGAAFQLAALHGVDATLSNDWGPLALALLLASASVFRPRFDQYFAGLTSVVVVGTLLAVESLSLDLPFGTAFFVVSGISPLVIIVTGQASYTGKATRTIVAWRRRMSAPSISGLNPGVSKSIEQQLSTEFGEQVNPLLVEILKRDRITATDVESARAVAGNVRQRLIELSAQSWLAREGAILRDEENLVNEFDDSARTALTAVIQKLLRLGLDAPTVALSKNQKRGIDCELFAQSGHDGLRLRSELAPYLRVMYVVFDDVKITYASTEVRLKFHYGVEK